LQTQALLIKLGLQNIVESAAAQVFFFELVDGPRDASTLCLRQSLRLFDRS
jgi:hypothetical protein